MIPRVDAFPRRSGICPRNKSEGMLRRKTLCPPNPRPEPSCAPSRPVPSASRTIARRTGWSKPSTSTCRCIRPQTRVRATLKLSPNPDAAAPAPIVLDGDGLTLTSLKLDGAQMHRRQLCGDAGQPDHRAAAGRHLLSADRNAGRSVRQHAADGSLPLERHLLHAMRGRRLPPHHLFPRPPGRDGGLHHAHRGGEGRSAGAARQRQSGRAPATCPAPRAISRCGTIRSPSPRICSRWSAAISACVEDTFVTMSGRNVVLRIYVEPGKEDRCAWAMDSLKRSMRWDEEAFGREYDLDIFMIVAVSDFNMGAMENKGLNIFNDKYVLASSGNRDRRRLRQHRGDHRARVFPQLDRRPHHLPRLVPALPEGRPDGLPRPGIHLRPALAPGQAHQRRARCCARTSSSRMRAPSPIRCGRRSIARSTTSTPRPSTRRAPRSCAC